MKVKYAVINRFHKIYDGYYTDSSNAMDSCKRRIKEGGNWEVTEVYGKLEDLGYKFWKL